MNFNAEIEVDLNKLKENIKILKHNYNDYKYIFANIKNNAFGMGYGIVDTLIQNGVNYLYVSTLSEALEIRKRNENIAILVNSEVEVEYIFDALAHNITITISNLDYLRKVSSLPLKDKLCIHLLIDNGSNKIGLKTRDEMDEALYLISTNPSLVLEGVYTELTTYGIVDEEFYYQFNQFSKVIGKVMETDLIVHLNEPIMYHKKQEKINGIRFDLSLLGIEENIDDGVLSSMKIKSIEKKYNDLEFPDIDLDLIFTIKARIIHLSNALKGTLVGRNFIAREDMKLAILPIGHKDGITKAIGYVKINDCICNVVADEIDYLVVALNVDASLGDEAVILDEDSDIYSVLVQLRTNRFYLMSILNNNLPRTYVNELESENVL